jgi:hypothetical protein
LQIVEAARHLSERMLKEGGSSLEERVRWMFRTATHRQPSTKEISVLSRLYEEQRALFAADASSAQKLLTAGEAKNDATLDAIELAAGTVLAQALLNHDGAIMRR